MKKLLLFISLILSFTTAWAIPAKPGLWRTITLADSTQIEAQLMGDEYLHYWKASDGRTFVEQGEFCVPRSEQALKQEAVTRRAAKAANRRGAAMRNKVVMGERTNYTGIKRGIVILAEFTNQKFKTGEVNERYQKILNQEDYNEGNFKGSVADYFKAQSGGIFELDFDVLGPYTLPHVSSYYGQNDNSGNDMRVEEMITEACKMADEEVDFADYDWDGDGSVDQVFVLYAGKGEADGGSSSTIWPQMFYLSATNQEITLDGVTIDTYACSNELDTNSRIEGIGAFCHEFSHCMGFPDLYDTDNSGWAGMGHFDLMASGNYNGGTFIPAGYSAYEKWMCGWLEPTVLDQYNDSIANISPMSENGEAYVIYNDAHADEYYMIENRQLTKWDAGLPARGMMISHIDFDKDIWALNIVNTRVNTSSYLYQIYHYPLNDHQRLMVVPADNRQDSGSERYDLYPYGAKDSLTATSRPVASFYNKNAKGSKLAEWAITKIKQNSDGTMSFFYRSPDNKEKSSEEEPGTEKLIFYESFDLCDGKGGNDGLWSGAVASGNFIADNEGWLALSDKMYGADACAKFGTSSTVGIATSPAFTVNGEAILTFKAGAWNATADGTELQLQASNATISPDVFEMAKGEWTEFTTTITGHGTTTITFTPGKRFFLDEVKVVYPGVTNITLPTTPRQTLIYSLDGRCLGTDINRLPHGLYIVNGRKVVR